jgi:Arc/MetJ-type ribon-helix-helix transcriptional regulator
MIESSGKLEKSGATMNLSLRPEIQRFIDEQVKAGRFATPEAVVEAAITELRFSSDEELDEQSIAAINEAEAQADRGEGIELDAFRAKMNQRLTGA